MSSPLQHVNLLLTNHFGLLLVQLRLKIVNPFCCFFIVSGDIATTIRGDGSLFTLYIDIVCHVIITTNYCVGIHSSYNFYLFPLRHLSDPNNFIKFVCAYAFVHPFVWKGGKPWSTCKRWDIYSQLVYTYGHFTWH